MTDIQPERGTLPIAYGLAEAFYKDSGRSLPERVLWWVLRNTYGRRPSARITKAGRSWENRRKTCSFTWTKIAEDIGSGRSKVSAAGRSLLASRRLRLDESGRIGVQKDPDLWLQAGDGGHFGTVPKCAHISGPGSVPTRARGGGPEMSATSYAREVLAERQSEPGVLPATAPVPKLPNGLPDTIQARAELGMTKWPPSGHPGWPRLFPSAQDAKTADWEDACAFRKRAEESAAYLERHRREAAKAETEIAEEKRK